MSGVALLAELTRDEVRRRAPSSTLILPTAAIEQHGPHLPLVTDTRIADGLASAVGRRAGELIDVCVAPTMPYGSSHHHHVYVAMSLRSSTLLAVVRDLLESAVLAGFTRIFVLNAHGGNDEIVKLAAREIALSHPVAIAANSYWSLVGNDLRAIWGDEPMPGHAGTFETSLMLAVAPHLVRESLRPTDLDHPVMLSNRGTVAGTVALNGEWQRVDGYSDAPIAASAERGRTIYESIVDRVASVVVAFHRETPNGPAHT